MLFRYADARATHFLREKTFIFGNPSFIAISSPDSGHGRRLGTEVRNGGGIHVDESPADVGEEVTRQVFALFAITVRVLLKVRIAGFLPARIPTPFGFP